MVIILILIMIIKIYLDRREIKIDTISRKILIYIIVAR